MRLNTLKVGNVPPGFSNVSKNDQLLSLKTHRFSQA